MHGVNGFYFETKVILIDDNQSFLDNLSLILSDNYSIETYINPFDAIKYIKHNVLNIPSGLIKEINDSEEDSNLFKIDFVKIYNYVNNFIKNNIISVIVVDYSMPILNGIDLCKLLSGLPIFKIMLTGHADFKLAVNALNTGIIDKFLIKDTDYMLTDISTNIDICQQKLFANYTNSILTCIPSSKYALISSEEYKNMFNKTINRLFIVEYYLINTNGAYLLISKYGKRYYLLNFENYELDEYLDIAKNANANINIIDRLKNKTHAPILIKDEDYKVSVSDWGHLLHPIEHKEAWHYCIIQSL